MSTAHSIVGAVLGAGMAAAGPAISRLVPLRGELGDLAGARRHLRRPFLYLVKRSIPPGELAAAARRTVPLLVGLMAWTFASYLILKGLNHVWKVDFLSAMVYGAVVGALVFVVVRKVLHGRRRVSSPRPRRA